MLLAAGVKLPVCIYGHGFITQSGAKISKSSGVKIELSDLVERLGADPLRFYLAAEVTLGQDGDFSIERFKEVYNADLANDYGNLLNRTLTMINKYHDGVVYSDGEEDDKISTLSSDVVTNYRGLFEDLRMKEAIREAFRLIAAGNLYIDEQKPWVLAKDPDSAAKLKTVLYNLVEALRVFTILIFPVMPVKTMEVWRQLGFDSDLSGLSLDETAWGKTENGHKTAKGDPVFPRME
jgi:methionyl-tRNA synthetase